jgi:hypothetical protein
MKNLKLLTLLWVILFAWTLAWCWNKNTNIEANNSWDLIIEDATWIYDAVINYNDSLVDIASQCIISEDAILTDYESGSDDILASINNTISQCQDSINQINTLWDWEWDSSLKDWIVKILELDIAYFWKFKELLPYLASEELSEEDADKYNTLVDEINAIDQEMETANNELISIQEEFAANHGYELQPVE